jgi:cytochrome c biogenesis protein CcmG/thiol:disulfide interchange protein DsbE
LIAGLVLLAITLAACAGPAADVGSIEDLEPVDVSQFESILADLDHPAVVNVWASWCIPCRSEAPLFTTAFAHYRDRIEFIGIDVQDNQTDAKQFIAEFDVEYVNYFDKDRALPNRFGGIGTPITFFFLPGGELASAHNGVIDERALALGIDELLRSVG